MRLRARRRRPRSGCRQEGLLDELPRPAGLVLFAGAEGARRLLVEELDAEFVPLYTRALQPKQVPKADVVVLVSPSAARAFAALGGETVAVSIGRDHEGGGEAGIRVIREAATHDLDGLLEALASVRP